MADNSSEQEPSIEEILASIRQIISDDDEDSNEENEVVEDPVRHKTDDVLELTEEDLAEQEPEPEEEEEPESEEETPESPPIEIDMRDVVQENRQEVPPLESPKPVPSDILSSNAQSAALSSIGKLKSRMPIERSRSYDGVTLEDIVRELLHPMLREWMDDNLPPMVERIVQKELEKLARRAMDD